MVPKNGQISSSTSLKWRVTDDGFLRARVAESFSQTNWKAICDYASRANGGQTCLALPQYTHGGSSLARLLEFQDGTRWIARIQMLKPTTDILQRLRTEIDTIRLLKAHTKALVPQVFAYELDDQNLAMVPFVLLEFLPGNTAMDEARSYDIIDGGLIPVKFRQVFYRSMAATHVQIASARLPLIGTVFRDQDGTFTVGPIPGIGGPFRTAASFIQAWCANIKYPYREEYIRKHVPESLVDEILRGVAEFPSRLARLASSGKYFTLDGPFPIRHPDLFHSNVIVNNGFNVLGVIDWEGACAVPWELIDPPCFLSTVPRLLNPPEQYDTAGLPLEVDEAIKWADEKAYAAMVRAAERDANADSRLSDILSNRNTQDLAGIVHLFAQGKIGLYSRVLDYLENKANNIMMP
ncbi:kinase-like domain-containing protein [Stachybotrys elegans]|uniref:Kinase-like domain-containing protein n=1 Tax=Stachybotrys elegans TaxID=80388 RepID=A0A8K0S8Y6_9HYPO|nr:kinase-like domain-containing protein [Stachybotrys elegans]